MGCGSSSASSGNRCHDDGGGGSSGGFDPLFHLTVVSTTTSRRSAGDWDVLARLDQVPTQDPTLSSPDSGFSGGGTDTTQSSDYVARLPARDTTTSPLAAACGGVLDPNPLLTLSVTDVMVGDLLGDTPPPPPRSGISAGRSHPRQPLQLQRHSRTSVFRGDLSAYSLADVARNGSNAPAAGHPTLTSANRPPDPPAAPAPAAAARQKKRKKQSRAVMRRHAPPPAASGAAIAGLGVPSERHHGL